jgi:hypothetical protein
LPKRREGQHSGISWPVVIIGLLGHGTELGIQTTKKWDWTGNSDSAVFCFREENINSYKNEMRKVGEKTILCQLCDLRKSCTMGLTKCHTDEFVQSHFSDGNLNPISNPTPP